MPIALLKDGLRPRHPEAPHLRWTPVLKRSYDVVLIGAGGHGLATASYLAARADHGTAVFNLLVDSASATYLLACLLDAAAEFEGSLIGLDSFVSQVGTHHGQRSTAGLASTDPGGASRPGR